MRNCSFLFIALTCAPFAWSQAAPQSPMPSLAAPAGTSPKAQGAEAVAKADPNRVVAVIEGKQITAKQAWEKINAALSPEQRKQYEAQLPNVLQQIMMQESMAAEATKLNLDQQAPWKDRLTMARESVLANAYLVHMGDEAMKASGDDPKKYYDSHPEEFDTVKLSGIFTSFNPPGTPAPTTGDPGKTEAQAEAKANDIEKKLKAGGDFSAIARTDNDNPGVASKGGELGSYDTGDTKMPPVLRAAIGKLQPGQISEPVRMGNMFLIVRLDSRTKQPFSDVQATLSTRLKTEKTQAVAKQEADKFKIKVEDQDFFNAPGAPVLPSLQKPAAAK